MKLEWDTILTPQILPMHVKTANSIIHLAKPRFIIRSQIQGMNPFDERNALKSHGMRLLNNSITARKSIGFPESDQGKLFREHFGFHQINFLNRLQFASVCPLESSFFGKCWWQKFRSENDQVRDELKLLSQPWPFPQLNL